MKILILSAVFHPRETPRATRTTELALELAKQGHDVTVYAILGKHNYESFEKKYNLRVKNIGRIYFSRVNSDGAVRESIFNIMLYKILNKWLEFPDIQLAFKIPRILNSEQNVDILISIAHPFPIHWGCALAKWLLKDDFPQLWVADCGDPYMGNKVAKGKRMFYFKNVEKWFCRNTDFIAIPFEGARNGYYQEFYHKIKVIPQGLRFDCFPNSIKRSSNSAPHFAYAGTFYKNHRDPTPFLEYLSRVEKEFVFTIYTRNKSFIEPFMKKLGNRLIIKDYIPREKLYQELLKMDFLINFSNNSEVQLPSKLIEYSLLQKPILNIPPDKLNFDTINEFLNFNFNNQLIINNIQQYNISNVAKLFIDLKKTKNNTDRKN